MKKPVRILIVEDRADDADLAKYEISRVIKDCEFEIVETFEGFMRALETFCPDIILSDYALPHFDGMKALTLTLENAPQTPFIMWTGSIGEDVAVDCMKTGANNYILKDNLTRLGPAIIHALEERELVVARKQAEEALQNNEKRYRALFEDLPIPIWEEDFSEVKEHLDSLKQQGITDFRQYFATHPNAVIECADRIRVVGVNNATLQMYHANSKDDLLENINQGLRKSQMEYLQEAFIGMTEGKTSFVWEGTDEPIAGKEIKINIAASVMPGYENDFSKVIVAITDITERKMAEEALQNSERRFRGLTQNGLDSISLLGVDGTLLWESPAAIRTLNYAPNEHLGHNIFVELMHPNDLEWTREVFTKVARQPGSRQHGIFRLRHADGTWHWVEAIITNMLDEPGIHAIVANYRDITDQKQAEIELQQRNDDLALINALNEVINRGENLEAIVNLLRQELKRIFSSEYTNIYLLDQDRQSIKMEQYALPADVKRKIEKVIGRAIPAINIPVQEDGYFQRVLRSDHGILIDSPEVTQKWMGEFIETASLPPIAKAAIRRLLPQLYKILNIKSTILVPLISDGKALGLLNVSGSNTFTAEDLKRIENICGQLTTALYRRQVEETLNEERNLLRTLIDNLPDRIYVMDVQGRKTLSNAADWKASGGKTMEDVIGRTDFDLYPPELAEEFWKFDRAVLDSGQPLMNYEEPGLDADGNRISVLTSKLPLRDENGNVIGLVGIGRDITERKQAEEALRASESRFRTFVDHATDAFFLHDERGTILDVNHQACESLGYRREELIGLTPFDFDPDLAPATLEQVLARLDNGEVIAFDSQHRRKDGTAFPVEIRIRPFWEGGHRFAVSLVRDITERKQAEERLRYSENRYQLVTQATNDIIWEWNPETHQLFWSENAQHVFGYSEKEIGPDETWWDNHIHPEDRERVLTKLNKLIEGKESIWMEEYRFLLKDGSYAYISDRAYIERDANCTPLRMIGAMSNITERKLAEETLRQSQSRYRALVETQTDFIVRWQPDGIRTFANEAYCKYFGFDPERALAEKFVHLIYEDDRQDIENKIQRLISGATNVETDIHRVIKPDGSIGWQEWTDQAIRDNYGHLIELQSVGRDITERKQAEERINDLLAFNEKILNHSSIGILTYKATGECVFANETVASIVGARVEQLMAQNFHTVESWKEYGLYDLVEKTCRTQEPVSADIHMITTFGKDVWMTVHCVTFKSKEEEHILLSVTDITERKQAEEKLRESENRLILALSGAQMSVWEWDLQTNHILWSPEFFEFTGIKEEGFERTFESFTDLIHPQDAGRVTASAKKALTDHTLFAEEFRILRADGEVRWLSNLGHPEYDSTGSYLRLIGTIQDITPRKQAEIERQTLLEIMQGFTNTQDLHKLLQLVHQSIAKVVYAENFFVVLYQESSGLFEEIYSVDQYDPPESPSRLENSITSYVYRSGKPLLLTQALFDKLVAQGEVKLVGTDSASWLGVPLKTSGRTIGVMAVQDYENENRYSDHDKDFLSSIATQVALVIEHRRAGEALRESEEHYRTIFEGVQDAILVESLDGKILMVNARACEMFGYTQAEFLTKTVADLVPPGQAILMADGTEVSLSPEPRETINQRANGEAFPIEISGRVQMINGEKVLLVVVRDITERKQAEEKLKRSTSLLYATLESTTDGILVVEKNGKITNLNRKFLELWQIPDHLAEQMDDDLLLEYVLKQLKDPSVFLSKVKALYQSPEDTSFDELEFRDGRIFERYSQPQRLGDTIVGRVWSFRDVTERKRAEAAEREQRALAEALRDTAETLNSTLSYGEVLDHILTAVGHVVPHDAGSILLIENASAKVVRSHGYDKHDYETEIMGIKLPLAETTNLRQMMETRRPVIVHDTFSYAGWQRIPATDWLRSNVGAPISIYGEIIGFICLDSKISEYFTSVHAERLEAFANQAAIAMHNAHLLQQAQEEIAERKRSEDLLRESNSRFRTLFEASPDAIVLLDPKQGWSIIDCNTAACQMNGYAREELLGQCIDILNMTPGNPEERSGYLERIQQDGVLRYETSHRRKDGTVFTVDVSTSLIKFDTRDLILGIDRDATERKRAEEEIRRSAEETSALLQTSLALTNLDLEATLQTIGNSANSLFLADGCRIFLMEPDDGTLRCVLALGENTAAFSDLRIKLGEGVTGAVAASGMAEIVNEMQTDPRAMQVPGTDEEKEAVMFAPLKERDRTIGILSVRRVGENQRFEPADLGLLEAFASMAASAVSKARLFEETQHRLADLRASEERFRQLAENIQEVFWVTDAESGKEIYISPAGEMVWGRSVEYLMYEPNAFINCVFPEDRPAVLRNIEREKNGEKVEMEYRAVWPNGSIHWVWDRAFPIFDDSGRVKRIAGLAADITERKQADQQLRKLSRAVNQSGSTIVITDTSGNIEYVNPKFTQVTGYSFEEIVGQNPRLLKSGFTADEEYKQLWQTITSGGQWHGELLNRKKNGELFWESVTISPILNDRGEITHFVGVKEDITERKQSELETRRHLAELEAVYENGLSVGRLLEPGEIGNRVIETFARHLPWHHVTIRLRKEDSEDLELVSFNLPNLKEEERIDAEQHFVARINKVGQGLSGWVIQTGVPLRTGNVHAHPQYIDTHAEIQSGLYMPLKVGERVIGVISVESEASNAFTKQDERLLATLANQTAVAFENARLYEAMQKELSERRRVEDALRVSETHYRALADSITDILFELDQDLHYTHWNKASEAITRIPAQDAVGKSMEEVLGDTEEQARIRMIYEDVLRSHQPRTFETTLVISGENRSFEVNAYPSMRGVSVVAKDVTDRKRTEIIMQKRFELMEYSARHSLKDLMQKTVDEVSELTGSTIGFFHFMEEDQIHLGMQTWSTSALELFRVATDDGAHLPIDQAGVWADAVRQRRPLIQNDYGSLVKKKGVPQGHVPILREIVVPIIRNECIMAVLGVGNKPQNYRPHDLEIAARLADYAWDITQRKQMEVALELERNQLVQRVEERTADLSRANSNLARALRVKDEFLANMSHELRTPLNAILGLSESLGEQIAGPLNEKQQKYISTISESGHHLLSLINDILDLAKIDAGHITLDINKVDIRSVCQASLRMIKQLAQRKNQEVSLEIDDGLGLMWADERRLKQMIVNLLGNAVKFTPENGKLGLEIHGDEEANQVAITVWDNGIGIRDDDLARLFQPFVQLDSGLAREATGTGLGLALVAQMARLHGGSVNVTSETTKGSRFTIVLPWEPALAMDTASRLRVTGKFRAIQVDEKNKPTILLVEDTKEVVMMLQDYLELAGYKVFTAQDGIDGIVQARHVKPDLILMDVQMPRMDGFETTRKLRSDPNFRYTPIVALTALAMPHDRERCLAAGMDEYISKPVNLKALVKIIQSCLFEREPRAR